MSHNNDQLNHSPQNTSPKNNEANNKDENDKKIPEKVPQILQTIPIDEKPTGNFYKDIEIFFKQLSRSYKGRYTLWENSFLSAMNILKVVQRQNEKNTKIVLEGIQQLEKRILHHFEQYRLKMKEIEKYSETELQNINQNFKHTLELLRMEIREFILQNEVSKLLEIYK